MATNNLMMTTKSAHPKISIITINYRQIEVTLQFLESTKLLTYPNFEILLIDNGCLKDYSTIIASRFPKVIYFISKKNLGFAGANNLGMKMAKGDFFFIVNNDTEVTPNLLQNLINPFFENNKIGAVSPKIKYFDQPTVIQYAGFTKVNHFTGRNNIIGFNEEDTGQHDVARSTSYAHGAAMLVKREVIESAGLFYEGYFMYYEELDWSERMVKQGYEIYYQPLGVIYHKASFSIGKKNPLKTYYHTRNRILFMRRAYLPSQLIVFYLYYILVAIPATIIRFVKKGAFSHIMPFFRGIIWNLFNRSNTLKQIAP